MSARPLPPDRNEPSTSISPMDHSSLDDGQKPTSILRIIVVLGLLVGLCAALWVTFFLVPFVGLIHARLWTPATCEILSSRVTSHWDSGGDNGGMTYGIQVSYRWSRGGVAYTGDRYDFYGWSST